MIDEFKPKTKYEVLRWAYFTERHLYENLDDDPRIGLIGNYKLDVQDVISEAVAIINQQSTVKYDFKKLVNGYRRVDAMIGAEYVLDLEVTKPEKTRTEQRRMYLIKPFTRTQNLPTTFGETAQTVNFIMTLSRVTSRVEAFMQRYEEVCLKTDDNTSLLVVLFTGTTAEEEYDVEEVKNLLISYQEQYPEAMISFIETKGTFSRAVGLDLGIKQFSDNSLLFLCDVDVGFDNNFLNRCRRNTIYKQQAYFPIVFSLYDPALIYQDVEGEKIPEEPSQDITKHNGFWVHYGYGMACLYNYDYRAVGGFDITTYGWGGEDVELYNRFIKSNVKVFRAVDPALIHHYHNRSCDPELSADQYRMCIGALADSIGSKSQLAKKVLGLKKQ
ncbi:chondroitin sulfate synthase 1-like [Glandiceps talaboti]